MTLETILITYAVAVVAILLLSKFGPPWCREVSGWALVICTMGAGYLAVRRQLRPPIPPPYHLDTEAHEEVDERVETIDDRIAEVDEEIEATEERGYFSGGSLGGDMKRRLDKERDDG